MFKLTKKRNKSINKNNIYNKSREDKFREDTLRSMEEAALEEYKEKDIGENRDFTARLYNNGGGNATTIKN